MRQRKGPAAIALALAVAAVGGLPADAKPKQDKPSKALRTAAKHLKKLKSYKVDFEVRGGTAQGADHSLTDTRVSETWSAKVKGKVDAIKGETVFRLRRGGEDGAIEEAGRWKAMLATKDGRLISRLFQRVEHAIAGAWKHRKRARWVQPKASNPQAPQGAADAPEDADKSGSTTKDAPKTGPGSKDDAEGPISHVIRVEAPPVEAVSHFNRIITSGCFSEG